MPEPEAQARDESRETARASPVRTVLERVEWQFVLPVAAALALGIGALYAVKLIARPLGLLIVAITIAEALAPLVGWVEDRIHRRALSIAAVYLGVAVVLGALGWVVAPTLVHQAQDLSGRLPSLIQEAQQKLNQVLPAELGGGLGSFVPGDLGSTVMSLPLQFFSTLLDVFVIVFLSVYWLLGSRAMQRFTLSLIPQRHRQKAENVMNEAGQSMGGYVRGAVINAFVMGVLAWLGLMLIGMPYAIVLGVLTMLGEIIPVIGPVIVGAVVTGLALLQSFTLALLALGLFVALEQIEGHLLTPNIMRSQTHVPQTLVLFAIVVGFALGGVLGILVAIPTAAALRVLVIRVIAPAERGGIIEPAE